MASPRRDADHALVSNACTCQTDNPYRGHGSAAVLPCKTRHASPMFRLMSKIIFAAVALLFAALPFAAAPVRAADNDRALLATFCAPGDIQGATCKRAKGYPNAPSRGCGVTLNEDRYSGKFLASGNPLLVVNYDSGCEAHAT